MSEIRPLHAGQCILLASGQSPHRAMTAQTAIIGPDTHHVTSGSMMAARVKKAAPPNPIRVCLSTASILLHDRWGDRTHTNCGPANEQRPTKSVTVRKC